MLSAAAWFEKRWTSLVDIGVEIGQSAIEESLVDTLSGRRPVERAYIWVGDILDEQLFAAMAITMLGGLPVTPLLLLVDCTGSKLRAVRGMAGLHPDDLLTLPAVEVGATELEEASNVWDAVTATEVKPLNQVLSNGQLPGFLEVTRQLARRYPSAENGLEVWEEWLLRELASGSGNVATTVARCISEGQAFKADRVGDQHLLARIAALGGKGLRSPLLEYDETVSLVAATVKVTRTGERVLAGDDNHLVVNDVKRQVGGVTVSDQARWCYDGNSVRLLG